MSMRLASTLSVLPDLNAMYTCRNSRKRKKAQTLQLHKKPAGPFDESWEAQRSSSPRTPGWDPWDEARSPARGSSLMSPKPALKRLPALQVAPPNADRLHEVKAILKLDDEQPSSSGCLFQLNAVHNPFEDTAPSLLGSMLVMAGLSPTL